MFIDKKDFEEPCCPLKNPNAPEGIPVCRVIEKLDEYLSKADYAAAERHLAYWLAETDIRNDEKGRLTVLNEQIGLFRKTAQEEKGKTAINAALNAAEKAGYRGTVTCATTYINAATAYKAFGQPTKALSLYEKAREIYEEKLLPDDRRKAGLYNNTAVTLTELKKYREAGEFYSLALGVLKMNENTEGEAAVTLLNTADLYAAQNGTDDDRIPGLLEDAEKYLNTPSLPRDGGYAFICEKCAPVFDYYGYFAFAGELRKRAENIYERN